MQPSSLSLSLSSSANSFHFSPRQLVKGLLLPPGPAANFLLSPAPVPVWQWHSGKLGTKPSSCSHHLPDTHTHFLHSSPLSLPKTNSYAPPPEGNQVCKWHQMAVAGQCESEDQADFGWQEKSCIMQSWKSTHPSIFSAVFFLFSWRSAGASQTSCHRVKLRGHPGPMATLVGSREINNLSHSHTDTHTHSCFWRVSGSWGTQRESSTQRKKIK